MEQLAIIVSFLLLLVSSAIALFTHAWFIFSLPRKVLVLQVVLVVALVCAPGLEPVLNLLATGSLYPGSLIRCVLGLIARKYGLQTKDKLPLNKKMEDRFEVRFSDGIKQ